MIDVSDLWFDAAGSRYFSGANNPAAPAPGSLTLRRLAMGSDGQPRSTLADVTPPSDGASSSDGADAVQPASTGLQPVEREAAAAALGTYFDTLTAQTETLFLQLLPSEAEIAGFDVQTLPQDPEALLDVVRNWLLKPERVTRVMGQLQQVTLQLANGLELTAAVDDEALKARIAGVREVSGAFAEMTTELGRKRLFGDGRKLKALAKQLEQAAGMLPQRREQRASYKAFMARMAAVPDPVADADLAAIFPG
ncbi:MAG: hypothetical protein KC502_21430 [Myxococcales bacterium]|nr:hypothetical protein [Myxococcales bacterium]